MTLKQSFARQFMDVIPRNEPKDGMLADHYPTEDMEIQNGCRFTVRGSQVAVLVNAGKVAEVFRPGLHTLTMSPAKPGAGAPAFTPTSTGAVRYCIDCGRAIPEGAKFCPGCGRAQ